MKTIRQADIIVGCGLAILGLLIVAAASHIRIGVVRALSPRFFPSVLGYTIFACGALLALKSWRFKGEDPKIHWPDRQGVASITICLALLAVFIYLLKPLGLPIVAFLYVTASIWFLKPERWYAGVLAGLVVAVLSYVLFIHYLQLSFPVGPLLERLGLEG